MFRSRYCSTHISVRYTACYKGGKPVLFVEYMVFNAPKDDWYQGYFIPKGTMCFAHVWYFFL